MEQLGAQREEILSLWRQRVEANSHMEQSSRLSRVQFYDHIPQILDSYHQRLLEKHITLAEEKSENEVAHQHSRHRWQQGYSLRALLHEWGFLNLVMIEALENIRLDCSPEMAATTLARARVAWAELVNSNISESAAAYNDLLQREAGTRLNDVEKALARAQEWERARGELLRQTSHDLRGGLSLVSNASELLGTDRITPDERGRVTQILHGGVRSLSDMLSDLLTIARLEAGQEKREIAPFDAARLLGNLGARAQTLAQDKGLWLRFQGPEPLEVTGDATKIERIAQNLLLNALGYTQQGGVSLGWGQRGSEQWYFEISDTGPGIDSHNSPLASEIKTATREAREVEGQTTPSVAIAPAPSSDGATTDATTGRGEGIGLSIVRRLCELLDASLELDSSSQSGTCFRVILPAHYN